MQSRTDPDLDDLLTRWWQRREPIRHARGYPSTAPGCERYRASRQYESAWMVDEQIEGHAMDAVDREVCALPALQRAAIAALAQSLVLGEPIAAPMVLPDPLELEAAVREARAALARRLAAAGVL